MTTGGQQVLDLVCRTFIDPGDVVIAEGPTYPGMLPTLGGVTEADVRHIPMDGDGMLIDALQAELERLDAAGRRPS